MFKAPPFKAPIRVTLTKALASLAVAGGLLASAAALAPAGAQPFGGYGGGYDRDYGEGRGYGERRGYGEGRGYDGRGYDERGPYGRRDGLEGRGGFERRGDVERRGGGGYGRQAICVTSRGTCPAPPLTAGASCRCQIEGFGPKRGAVTY